VKLKKQKTKQTNNVAKNLLLLFKTEKTLLFATSELNNHKEPHLISVVLIFHIIIIMSKEA